MNVSRSTVYRALRRAAERLVAVNVTHDLEPPRRVRRKARPWQPADLGRFLDHAGGDRLGPVFELLAATGLRRDEALGLRWADLDLPAGRLTVHQQLLSVGGRACCGPPKTASGEARTVDLDANTIALLQDQRATQDPERAALGAGYAEHGLVFARQDGAPIHPDTVTARFAQLAGEAGLPRPACTTCATPPPR